MNYYIKGNAANADKIKAAFEKLGYDTITTGWKFDIEGGFFYTHDGKIDLACSKFLINLIKTHPDYKELELPVEPKFKVGDWVVSPNGSQYLIAYIDKEDNRYLFEINEYIGEPMHYEDVQVVDGQYHLWTIVDSKDGDVLVSGIGNPFIYNSTYKNIESSFIGSYVGVSLNGEIRLDMFPSKCWTSAKDVKPATKQERDLLFSKMREVGYEWDADKKELHKIKPHYDIANFHAGMPVLVRDYNNSQWSYVQFSHLIAERNVGEGGFKFNACGIPYIQCIPFNDDTKHLLGTTDMPSKEYINWR